MSNTHFTPIGTCRGIETNKEQWEIIDKYRDGDIKLNPGDFVVMESNGAINDMLISCPQCGECSFSGKGNHGKRKIIMNEDATYSSIPSLIFQCCGWHGFLTKNKYHL